MSTFKARQKALRSSTQKFLATSALTAAGLVSMGITANAQNVAPDALPQGAEVTRGSATYDYSQPNTLTIEQHAALTSAEYKGGFNIGQNAAVLMLQDSGDIFVHIDKSDNTSFIEGLFSGSGSNFVLNKNGVIVTGTARIDMNSFVASTAESLDLDRLDAEGKAVFTDFGEGAIIIEEGATVTVAEAGLAAFVSPFVSNAGVINARMGTVAIGAGETVTLDLYGDGLVELAVEGELGDALIENTGTISAEGGKVQISARAAKDAVDNIINVDGVVTASSASVQGGKIVLSGGNKGTVAVKGTVDASGEGAGDIDVTGENITIADTAELKADGGENGDGGNIKIIASDKAIFRGSASARGGAVSGKGGFVETSGFGYIDVAGGFVNTLAADGTAGTWLIDPTDITIVFDNPANPSPFTVAGATSIIGWAQIGAALLTSDVAIATTSGGPSTGNITFDDPLLTGGGVSVNETRQSSTLEFIADNNIIVNDDITISNVGTTTLNAGGSVIFNQDFKTFDATSLDPTVSGNLVVNANGDINVAAGSTVGVNGAGFGDVTLSTTDHDITIAGTVQSLGGDVTLETQSTAFDKSIDVLAGGSVVSNDGNITLDSNGPTGGFTTVAGNVDAGAGDITVNARQFKMTGTATVNADELDITAGAVTQTANAAVTANLLTGMISATASLTGQNDIGAVGDFMTGVGFGLGGLELNDINGGLDITGAISSVGGDVDIDVVGDLDIAAGGSVNANGGNVDLFQTGAFSSGDDTVQTSGTGTITLQQNVGGLIQDTVDAISNSGNGQNTVNVGAGTFTESVLIDRALTILGSGRTSTFVSSGSASANAFTVDGDFALSGGGKGRVGIFRVGVSDSKNGVEVMSTATNMFDLIIGGASFSNNALTGVRVNGDSTPATLIQNTNFTDNGHSTTSGKGDGDILFWLHNGDVTLKNVHITNNSPAIVGGPQDGDFTADYGIQIRGSDTFAASGDLTFENVSIAGNYRASMLGIQRFTELGSLSITDVTLGGLVGGAPAMNNGGFGALWLSSIGAGDFSLGNLAFADLDPSYTYIANHSLLNFDATGVDFEGVIGGSATTAESFAIEDRVDHKMDLDLLGLVTWKDGELFVTQGTAGIQHAINIADAGDTVNVDGTEYQEDLTIDKELKLTGHGTTLKSNGADNLITVTAANVNIDPFTFDGLGVALYGIHAAGAGALGLVVDGNTFQDFVNAGVYVEGQSASTGTIVDNIFKGSSTVGVETGVLKGDYVLNIEGNTFGSEVEKIETGVKVFRLISGGTVNIADSALKESTIHSSGDGIRFVQGLRDQGRATITGIDIVSDGNAVDVEQKARKNSRLTISGGSYEGGPNGIKLSGVDERGTFTIEDATIKGETGILSDTTSIGGSLTIDGNTVEGTNGNAVELAAGVNGGIIQIINNDNIKASESGIVIGGELEGDADITIDKNRVRFATNGAGIDVNDATFGGLANLDVTRNSVWRSGTDGIILNKTANAAVENNNIGYYGSGLTPVSGTDVISGDGIEVIGSEGASVKDNNVINTGENGIKIVSSDDSFVQGNSVKDTGVAGIRVESSDAVTVNMDNNIDGTHNAGIGLHAVTNSLIDGNTISNTGGSGVWMKDSDGTTVSGNIIDGTWKRAGAGTGSGVHVVSTDDATVSGNTIDNTNRGGNGVYAEGSDNLKVNGNFIGTVGGNISGNGVAIDGAKTAEVNGNEIKNVAKNGIKFIKGIKDGAVEVINNDITAALTGILFGSSSPSVENSAVYVVTNTVTASDDAVRFDDAIDNSTVEFNGNTLTAGSEGIDVLGAVTDSRVTLGGNVADPGYSFAFQTINADDNGVVFRGDVTGSQIYMPRQQITALDGEAVLFKGVVDNSRVSIGQGEGDFGGVWLSNINGFFTGSETGILFEENVQNSSVIEIVNTTVTGQGGEGVHFEGDVDGSSVLIAGSTVSGQDGDAIQFEGEVTNSSTVRIGEGTAAPLPLYTAAFGPFPLSYGGNTITGSENGIVFNGVNGGSTVDIDDNIKIEGQSNDGIVFNGASPSISGGAVVNIKDNTEILADNDGIKVEDDISGSGTQLNIRDNKIVAGEDGIDIDNVRNNAVVKIGGSSYSRDGNWIIAGNDGIEFDAGIDSTVLIQKNRIDAGDDGIDIADDDRRHTTSIDSGAVVSILENRIGSEGSDTIGDDGIVIDENITGGATLTISGNSIGRSGAKVGDDGIDLDNISGGATVNIVNNPNNYASDNGINISGSINGATLNITGNNHGIHADDHGIYVGGAIYGGSTVNIHDNIISANEDDGSTGDGIHFAGNIYTANINIGDGSGSSLYSNPSNFIRGKDGIHFAGSLNSGTKVKIDGNRIGYGERSYGRYPIFSDAVSDDGIQFAQDVQGNANVKITDNFIKSDDDGVSFLDDIQDDARVLIGGHRDGNTIDADDEGIQFGDEIKGHSLLEISYNDIDADDNGIQFDGETSNHIHSGHGEEILIKNNSIEGGEHGILFNGKASNWRHDIVIRDNSLIKGDDENGITHVGNIDDAELWILNNDKIDGDEDGIHIEGYFYNGAKIVIEGNGWDGGVRGRDDDGIHVKDTGYDFGSDVLIKKNHVHYTGDDGIFVRNVKGVKIIENDIHDTGLESRDGDGIFVVDSDYALIKKNEITGAGRDGINLYSSYRADILFNDIYAEGGNRFFGRGQQGAGRDGIHVEYSDKVDVIGNDITSDLGYGRYAVDQLGAGRHGIYVAHSDGADVKFNDVLGDVRTFFGFPIASVDSVGENGIYVYKSHFADVKFNDVERTGTNGIKLRKSAFGDIGFNKVDRAGDDGIDVEYGFFVDIFGNKVTKSRDDGIDVEDSFGADIKFNKVTESRRDGIEVDDSKYADIKYNLVVGAGDDGIDVDDSKFADIEYNLISFTKDDGIRVDDSFGANIMRNLVAFAGDDGIDVSDSSYVDVNGNFIRFVKRNGIEVSGGKQADIIGNNIRFVGRDGINVRNVYSMYNRGFDVVINENTVRDAGDDGIEVKYSGDTQIDFNTVTDVEDDGIRVYNPRGSFIMSYPDMYDDGPSMNIMRVSAYPYYEFVPANVEITNNTVTNAGTDGIEVTAYDVQLLADTNTVLNSGENGILLNALGGYGRYEDRVDDLQTVSLVSTTPYPSMRKGDGPQGPGVFNSLLINNGVENSGTNGIHAKGYGHGDVVLEGNTLVDNPVGARFESGAIDLTNLENPNTIIVNPDYELPEGYEFVTGLQFELAGTAETVASANSLTIVDETLGATAFTGFINRPVEEAFYVRFEDGAILDELGNVIVINGEQVNFDGFIPANNQDALGNIPAVALNAIEDRLFDADDPLLDGRGQIFIGTPATAGLDNVQDFFQQFSQFAPGFGGFNLTLLGLPPTSPPVGGFNNIQTFAGPGALNDINPAAGGESPEGLNDLEPAAGNESACWSDVINASATGGVNFNFSGDPTDNLNAAASCDS